MPIILGKSRIFNDFIDKLPKWLNCYLNGATIAIKDITIAIKHTILFTIIPILDDAGDL